MPGWWTPSRQAYAYNFLVGNGLSAYGAAGLVSRWANVESTAHGPASRGGYLNRAWGIAQWLGGRRTPIDGNSDFDAQLRYVIYELTLPASNPLNERRAAALLYSANDVQSGARAATAYERADGWNAATNTDYYTSKTAAGIPAVFSYAGAAVMSAGAALVTNTSQSNATDTALIVAVVGGAALLLYLVTE